MGAPRIKRFDAEGINEALERLYEGGVRRSEIAGSSGGGDVTTAQLDSLRNDLSNSFVPVTRKVNEQALNKDIVIDADQIPYDPAAPSLAGITVKGRIDLLSSLTSIDGSFDTYSDLITNKPAGDYPGQGYVVRVDETHNGEQWLYVWGLTPGTTDYAWKAVTVFGVNLDNYYTKGEVYNRAEIIADQLAQSQELQNYADNSTQTKDQQNRAWTSSQISLSQANTLNQANIAIEQLNNAILQTLALQLQRYVPVERTVNNKALVADILLDASNIPYKNAMTVRAALDTFENAISIQGGVDNEADLPPGLPNNVGYVVRNGTHYPAGPDGPYPELYVVVRGVWTYICRLLIDYSFLFTREEAEQMFQQQTENVAAMINALAATVANEVIRASTSENVLNAKIDNETSRAMLREGQIDAAVSSMGVNTLQQANNYTDTRVEIFFTSLNNKVDKNFTPSLVFSIPAMSATAVGVALNYTRTRLDGTVDTPGQTLLPLASASQAGIVQASDYEVWATLPGRVEAIEQQGTYIGQSFQTLAELAAWQVPAWVGLNDFTYVIRDESQPPVQGKYPTSKYIRADVAGVMQWSFELVIQYDPPSNFTLDHAGVIKGSELEGQIYPEANGYGSVVGFDALKNRVTALENRLNTLESAFEQWGGLEATITQLLSDVAALKAWRATAEPMLNNIQTQVGLFVKKTGDTMSGNLYVPTVY